MPFTFVVALTRLSDQGSGRWNSALPPYCSNVTSSPSGGLQSAGAREQPSVTHLPGSIGSRNRNGSLVSPSTLILEKRWRHREPCPRPLPFPSRTPTRVRSRHRLLSRRARSRSVISHATSKHNAGQNPDRNG